MILIMRLREDKSCKQIVINSSENFAVTIRIGRKISIVVFEDADIEGAVNGIIAAIMAHQDNRVLLEQE